MMYDEAQHRRANTDEYFWGLNPQGFGMFYLINDIIWSSVTAFCKWRVSFNLALVQKPERRVEEAAT